MEPNQQSEKEKQIVLRVTVAEVDKTAVRAMGFDPKPCKNGGIRVVGLTNDSDGTDRFPSKGLPASFVR